MNIPVLNGVGYKATRSDLTCSNDFKYDIGQVYVHTGTLELGRSGFHLCRQLHHTFEIYNSVTSTGNRYFVVSYDNTTSHYHESDDDVLNPMVVTSAIRLEEEIKVYEYLEMNAKVKRYPSEHMVLYIERYTFSPLAKEVVTQLLDAGADVHACNNRALRLASKYGHTEMVKLLLDSGADVHAYDDMALLEACRCNHIEIIKLLIDVGADVHINVDLPLKLASDWGHIEIVKLLLNAGADMHANNDEALRSASKKGHTEVVRLLLDRGADVHAFNDYVLLTASENGHTDVVKLLINAGADVHVFDNAALRRASDHGHTKVVKLLLAARLMYMQRMLMLCNKQVKNSILRF